jgi:hypothetical protein
MTRVMCCLFLEECGAVDLVMLVSQVLTPVLVLAHEDHDEHRSTAVALLHDLAPVLARDLCMSFVGHELVAMSEDPRFVVEPASGAFVRCLLF